MIIIRRSLSNFLSYIFTIEITPELTQQSLQGYRPSEPRWYLTSCDSPFKTPTRNPGKKLRLFFRLTPSTSASLTTFSKGRFKPEVNISDGEVKIFIYIQIHFRKHRSLGDSDSKLVFFFLDM